MIRGTMPTDLHAATLKIYREILDQLEELKDVYSDATDDDDAETTDDEDSGAQQDVLDAIIEEAAERGIDEEDVSRVFKAIGAIAKKAQES